MIVLIDNHGQWPDRPQWLICQSAWKGCFNPFELNDWLVQWLIQRGVSPQAIYTLPLSDGGDGWLSMMQTMLGPSASNYFIHVTGPLPSQTLIAPYLFESQTQTAYLETATIHGMACLPNQTLAPLTSTSYGVGEALCLIRKQQPQLQHIVVSIGGSASNDGGLGLLQALGWQFSTSQGNRPATDPITGAHLSTIVAIQPPIYAPLENLQLTIVTDVTIPYTDAPVVFGPQKGATPEDVTQLHQAFCNIEVLLSHWGDYSKHPGSGAAGGLGFGLRLASNQSQLITGWDWIQSYTPLLQLAQSAAFIMAGEGHLDHTSFMGKATGSLMQWVSQHHPDCKALVLCAQQDTPLTLPSPWQALCLYPNEHPSPIDAQVTLTDLDRRLLQAWPGLIEGLNQGLHR